MNSDKELQLEPSDVVEKLDIYKESIKDDQDNNITPKEEESKDLETNLVIEDNSFNDELSYIENYIDEVSVNEVNANKGDSHQDIIPNAEKEVNDEPKLDIEECFELIESNYNFTDCIVCDFKGSSGERYDIHMKNHHLGVKTYACFLCDHTTMYKKLLRNHIRFFHFNFNKKPQKEEDDDAKLGMNDTDIDEYFKLLDSKYKFIDCSICDYKGNSGQRYDLHMKNEHPGVKTYACFLCEHKTMYKSSLKAHVKIAHFNLKKFSCPTCSFEFNTKNHLARHVNNIHLKLKPNVCMLCDFSTGYKPSLRKHIKKTHPEEYEVLFDKEGTYLLPSDLHIYSNVSEFKVDHNKNKNNLKDIDDQLPVDAIKEEIEKIKIKPEVKCEPIDYSTEIGELYDKYSESNCIPLARVLTETTDTTNFPNLLKIERDDSSWVDSLKMKNELITEIKNFYPCQICQKVFTYERLLHTHIEVVHNKIKPYGCNECSFRTGRKLNLKSHIEITHLKIMRFMCNTCELKCHTRAHLRRHIATKHTAVKPFPCTACPKTFPVNGELMKHYRRVHLNVKSYECSHCSYKSDYKSTITRHIKNLHATHKS